MEIRKHIDDIKNYAIAEIIKQWMKDNDLLDVVEIKGHRYETFREYEKEFQMRCSAQTIKQCNKFCPLWVMAFRKGKNDCSSVVGFGAIDYGKYTMEYLDEILDEWDKLEPISN